METAKLIERIYRSVPYPHQVSGLDFTSESGAVRFTWRGATYRVSHTNHVEEVGDGVLIGSDKAILMERIITMGAANEF